jgi:hypothetical protein
MIVTSANDSPAIKGLKMATPDERSAVLPTDPFERALSDKLGHPDGAHTQPAVVQANDFYGNVTSYIVQTVKWAEGNTVFVTQVNASGSDRFMLPPKVMQTIDRQQAAVTTMVRRRHGRRLAETRQASGLTPGFTPAMRAKALATRKAKAAKRNARRARKAAR